MRFEALQNATKPMNLLKSISQTSQAPRCEAPVPPSGIKGHDYVRWLRQYEPEVFLPPESDPAPGYSLADLPPGPGAPDFGPDVPVYAADDYRPCADLTHGDLHWRSLTGQWACVGCWPTPPPRKFVQEFAGLFQSKDGEWWLIALPALQVWPAAWLATEPDPGDPYA